MATAEEKQTLRKKLNKYEGSVEHMYLDTEGNVTVGIGHLLSSLIEAQKLPFYNSDHKKAARDEINAEYENIKKRPYGYGYPANYYAKYTKLKIRQLDIDALTDTHIKSFESELIRLYPDFGIYPREVRLALFDMIFNLGMTKLRSRFPKFNAAIKAKDWAAAAKESNRPQLQMSRNRYVRELLEQAAQAESQMTVGAK